jgi:hypothetical protein
MVGGRLLFAEPVASLLERFRLVEVISFGFGVHAGIVERRLSGQLPDDAVTIDDQWLADADLVIVRTTQGGSVVRTLEVSDFEIQEAPPKPSGESR